MKTSILRTAQVKDLVKQFTANGYDVKHDGNGYIVSDSTREVFRALPNAVGNSYLVRYENGLIQAA